MLRKSDIASVKSALKQYKQNRGNYPIPSPGENFNILVGASNPVAIQWKLDNKTTLSTLDNIPTDPKEKDINYLYSTTINRQEFQIAATLENGDTEIALLDGDYSSVAKNILPTIMIAANVETNVISSADLFIFNNQYHNLPYNFIGSSDPVSDGTPLIDLLSGAEANGYFWQNSDFRSCQEIDDAGKLIWSGSYQVVSPSTGELIDVGC